MVKGKRRGHRRDKNKEDFPIVAALPVPVAAATHAFATRPASASGQAAAGRYFDRELSQLAFNERVLAMAARASVPLAERLRYVCIVSSNLDEFFEVRVSGLIDLMREDVGWTPAASLWPEYLAISERAHALVDAQYRLYNTVITPSLQRAGIVIVSHCRRR